MNETTPPGAPPLVGRTPITSLLPFAAIPARSVRSVTRALGEHWHQPALASRLLRRGVCGECSLSATGLRDETLGTPHLCHRRLERLHRHTDPPLLPADLLDAARLRDLSEFGALPAPFIRERGDRGFTRRSWTEIGDLIRRRGENISGEAMAFLAGGDLSIASAAALAEAARDLGANHLDLWPARDVGMEAHLREAVGHADATCGFSDLLDAQVIVLLGTGLTNSHPMAAAYVLRAKRRGARVVLIDPARRLEQTAVLTDPVSGLFGSRLVDDALTVRPAGDTALLCGALKALIERGALDEAFIEGATTGWPELIDAARSWSWADLCQQSDVTQREITWLAELIGRAERVVSVLGTGAVQHHGGSAARALAHLHLARGLVGRPGCGWIPLWSQPGRATARIGGIDAGGPNPLDAARSGKIELLHDMGGTWNPVATAALASVPVRIHQGAWLTPAMLVEPAELVILLPALQRHAQPGGSVLCDAERRLRFSPCIPGLPAPREARPAWSIPGFVSGRLRPALEKPARDATELREAAGVEEPRLAGLRSLRSAGDWVQWGGSRLHSDGRFPRMSEGRACFTTMRPEAPRPPEGHLQLAIRCAEDDRVRLSAASLAETGMRRGDRVRLTSECGSWVGELDTAELSDGVVLAPWPACVPLLPPATPDDPPVYSLGVTLTRAV